MGRDVLSDESRCLIGRVGRVALSYRTSRTSRAVLSDESDGSDGSDESDERGGDDLSDEAAAMTYRTRRWR